MRQNWISNILSMSGTGFNGLSWPVRQLTWGIMFRETLTRPKTLILGIDATTWTTNRLTALCCSPEGTTSSNFCRATANFLIWKQNSWSGMMPAKKLLVFTTSILFRSAAKVMSQKWKRKPAIHGIGTMTASNRWLHFQLQIELNSARLGKWRPNWLTRGNRSSDSGSVSNPQSDSECRSRLAGEHPAVRLGSEQNNLE